MHPQENTGLKIITNLGWPSFRNVALDVRKALKPYVNSTILDWKEAEPGGDVLFFETVRNDTLKAARRLLPRSHVVFYGTTEGRCILDTESIETTKVIKVVAVSNFVRRMLEESGVRVEGIVHHGIDLGARKTNAQFLKATKEKVKGKLVTLTVSSTSPRKGLDRLLQAYKAVEKQVPNSFLLLHSEPRKNIEDKQKRHREKHIDLVKLASKLEIERSWLTGSYGLMKSSEIKALYNLCHISVLPSFAEGFGLSMLEAFRFNKPVVAVNAPPFNEIIQDGCTGILFPYNKVRWFNYKDSILFKMHIYEYESLADAMIKLLSDEDLRRRMQANIKVKKHEWSIHKLYPKLLDYF